MVPWRKCTEAAKRKCENVACAKFVWGRLGCMIAKSKITRSMPLYSDGSQIWRRIL